jgi:hypothetical protein
VITAEHSAASMRGSGGGVIARHRTLVTVPLTTKDVAFAVALSTAFMALAFAALPGIFSLWRWILVRGSDALALGATLRHVPFALLREPVPMLAVDAPAPGQFAVVVALVVMLGLLVTAQLLAARALPATYFLCAVAIVLGSAVLVFSAGTPASMDLPAYTRTLVKVSAGIFLFVPLGYGLTLFLLDISWTRKAALMALAMLHLMLFIPLQTLVTLYVVTHMTLLVLPLLFVFAGVLPQIAVLIALYSWGASWPERTV